MPLVNFSFGVVELKELLTISAEINSDNKWQIVLHYKNENIPICIIRENEENAKECVKEVQEEIEGRTSDGGIRAIYIDPR